MSRSEPWTIREAAMCLHAIDRAVHSAGWILAAYGSVVKHGRGADLDLIAVPWRRDASHVELVEIIQREWGAKPEGAAQPALMATFSQHFRMPGGGLVDLQVRG